MKKQALMLAAGLALFAGGSAFSAQVLYVQSLQAKIYSQPDFGSQVVSTAQKGESVEMLSTKDKWYKIKHEASEGWSPSITLSERPPLSKTSSVFEKTDKDLSEGARKRASAIATAGASRGLVSEERMRTAAQGMKADWDSVELVETRPYKPEEALNFVNSLSN